VAAGFLDDLDIPRVSAAGNYRAYETLGSFGMVQLPLFDGRFHVDVEPVRSTDAEVFKNAHFDATLSASVVRVFDAPAPTRRSYARMWPQNTVFCGHKSIARGAPPPPDTLDEMKKLELTDLIPEFAKFRLAATGDHEHTLRPVDLGDRAWVTRTFGSYNEIERIFARQDMEAISKIVFHQLVDKSPFAQIEEDEWDDDGVKIGTRKVGGYRLVMRALRSPMEMIALMNALIKTVGISEPILEELKKGVEAANREEKKSAQTTLNPKSTGKKSSTSSKAPMGTRTPTSQR
jgi:hypothetical protein